ncbi:MAG: hypothetical protein U0670_10900 [Anaerolineae bacterium]
MNARKAIMLLVLGAMLLVAAGIIQAASGGSFVFDYVGDAGDNADGPQYDITLSGAVDDGANSMCIAGNDVVIMVIFDPDANVLDVDPMCILTASGTGSDDGDMGVNTAPAARPATYTLFDVDGAEATALAGLTEGSPAYISYLLANGVPLDEKFEDVSANLTGLPTKTPYSLLGGGVVNGTCTLSIPSGSVVGEAPAGAQIFSAPGAATNLTLNPGTYWVVGVDESGGFYKIVLACQFLWVPVDTMGPSYQAPQNGAPLPTRVVS